MDNLATFKILCLFKHTKEQSSIISLQLFQLLIRQMVYKNLQM